MVNRVCLPWRLRGVQMAAAAVLTACGGGSGDSAPVSAEIEPQQVAQIQSCAFSQAQVLVDEIRIGQPGAKDIVVTLPKPRAIDLLDPGAGVLETLHMAPLTQDIVEMRLRTVGGSTVRLEDGTVALLTVPDPMPLVGDFHLAAGMVADLVVQGFDRCGNIQAAGESGQFVLTGQVSAFVRALPFVTDREQVAGGFLHPLPGGGYATVSSPDGGSSTIQRFNAYGQSTGLATTIFIEHLPLTMQRLDLPDGGFVVAWLTQGNVQARRFGADGTPGGVVTQLNVTSTGANELSAVALPWGGFLIGWRAVADGSARDFVRFFDAQGLLGG